MDILSFVNGVEKSISNSFKRNEEICYFNSEKVLNAFRNCSVAQRHFSATNGYGYDDIGRDTLSKVYQKIFKTEAAIVSPNIVSGTHAISAMLFGILRPGNVLYPVTGYPYDTLIEVIDGVNIGSLRDFNIGFEQTPLIVNGNEVDFDYKDIEKKLKGDNKIKAVFIQRSRGYNWRNGLSVQKIQELCKYVKKINPNIVVMVDNCYGEFVETLEPTEVGADIVAGSLIKNPGGGIAPTGGYIVGREDLVKLVSYHLTAPSIGSEVGSYSFGYTQYYQGLFMAPAIVKNALNASLLFSACFSKLGFETLPDISAPQSDIVTSIKFNQKEQLIEFCRAIQKSSPVDSNLVAEPWDMPGYAHQVIMAAGTFVQGSSIELSADAPIKEPYIAYVQGALTYEHAKIALVNAISSLKLL